MSANTELRGLPAWRNVEATIGPQMQDDLAAWLTHVRREIADGFDARVGGNRQSAEAFRREAARSLAYALTLGLADSYAERVRDLIRDIESDDKAVNLRGAMATLGWPSYVGKRGGATEREGANRGWLVRMVASWLPETTQNRAATVAALVTFAGPKCSPQLARSILGPAQSRAAALLSRLKKPKR